jgi:hypothetical protein
MIVMLDDLGVKIEPISGTDDNLKYSGSVEKVAQNNVESITSERRIPHHGQEPDHRVPYKIH